jgi:hypothetical protein
MYDATTVPSKWDRSHEQFMAEARRAKWRMRRFTIASAMIPPGSSVLDLGCGSMLLREFLPPGCTYIPADLFADRHPEIIKVDLNKGEFPEGRFDVVVLLTTLGSVTDRLGVLKTARERSSQLVVSAVRGRRAFRQLLAEAGWTIVRRDGYTRLKHWRLHRGDIYLCR